MICYNLVSRSADGRNDLERRVKLSSVRRSRYGYSSFAFCSLENLVRLKLV